MTLADIFSAIDSAKRRGAGLLGGDGQTLGDLATGMGRSLLTMPADIGQQMANLAQGNPGNVLGQPQGMDQIRGLLGRPTSDAQDVGEAIGPPMKLAAKAAGLLSGKIPAMLAAHIAYHGSPYQFDKFDMSKIGTGEGAQAYGHGLYFAENPAIAQVYRDALSKSEMVDANGNVVYSPQSGDYTSPASRAANALQYAHDAQSSAPYQLASGVLRRSDDADTAAQAAKILGDWQASGVTPKPAGALYKVDINADPAHYLDWDAPLSEQSQHVQNALQPLQPLLQKSIQDGNTTGVSTGSDVVGALAPYTQEWGAGSNGAAGVSQMLRDAGIPGIKYKDAGSRTGDGGTHNYVVFDDSLINNLGAAP